jgi:hypothetical protein
VTRREWLTALAGVSPALLGMARQPPPADLAPADPTTLSIAGLGEALASGRLTPIDITAAYLKRIDLENPALGAYVTVARGRAFDETRRVLTALAVGTSRGPLTGVPVAHKDLLATRGVRTTGGSHLRPDWVPGEDAVAVARLAAAGAILLGKTNTHELGGGVSDLLALEQQPRRQLHPPEREILHRRLADDLRESIGEHRTRDPDRSCERLDGPRVGGLAVKRSQRLSHDGIPHTGEPPGLGWWERLDVSTNRLDEHQLRHARQDVFSARPCRA